MVSCWASFHFSKFRFFNGLWFQFISLMLIFLFSKFQNFWKFNGLWFQFVGLMLSFLISTFRNFWIFNGFLTVYNLLCSSWRPLHFNLLASCWAFFLSLQALEANLFFSLRLLQRAPKGISLTGVKSLIILLNCSNSLPIAANFLGLAVRSLPSPRRAFPLKSKKRYVQLVI